ncbi:hypothetical protein GGR51DRAFT_541589 [Nemania sp. FL0031]|nr:hypothetical protein GGR51DRAFT_541589 [Nemania sp. FL0031]
MRIAMCYSSWALRLLRVSTCSLHSERPEIPSLLLHGPRMVSTYTPSHMHLVPNNSQVAAHLISTPITRHKWL